MLGAAVSDISEMVIREMGETVKEMEKKKDRRFAHLHRRVLLRIIRAEQKTRKGATNMELTYTMQGDYLIPDLTVPESPKLGSMECCGGHSSANTGMDLHRDAAERNTEQSFGGGGPASQRDDGTPDPTDGREAGVTERLKAEDQMNGCR